MFSFAGGSWSNASNVLAQVTTTTNNVSVSRQGSEDETKSSEWKPLFRSQDDPLPKLPPQSGSDPFLISDVDPVAGRRFTMRGVARALPYFLRADPDSTTTIDESQRNVLSSEKEYPLSDEEMKSVPTITFAQDSMTEKDATNHDPNAFLEESKTEIERPLRDDKNKNKSLQKERTKEKATLINQSNRLRQQLDDAQKQSSERYDLIQRLEASKNDLKSTLRHTQDSVIEKEAMIQDMQRKNASLEESKRDLEGRLLDMEKALVAANETAQSELEETNKAHDRDITQAKARIQKLQDQLSSFTDTSQQLRSSLGSSHPRGEYYGLCRYLVTQVMASDAGKKLVTELQGDEAQCMVDFLSEILDADQASLSQSERKHTLHLLVKLAKSAQVFPHSLELRDIQCCLTRHVTGGGYGLIYKGTHGSKFICVKAVHIQPGGAVNRRKIRAQAGELIVSAHISHPNILPFYGIYLSEEEPPRVCIVSPWMENGDLLRYLEVFPNAPLIPLVLDIITGLKYLHDYDIVHADLKASNVLITGAHRAMLTDFGISRVLTTAGTTTANIAAGTAHWMAPELFIEDVPNPNCESDIWAFGCICYEITTGKTPFYQFKAVPHLISAFLKGHVIPSKPSPHVDGWDDTKEKIWSVAEMCWKRDPQTRPSAGVLQDFLASFDFSDDRPTEPEYPTTRMSKVDYDRLFSILNRFRYSPSTPLARLANDHEGDIRRFIGVRQQAQQLETENTDLRIRVKALEEDNQLLRQKLTE